MVREKFEWKGENFNRIEKIYSNGKEKVFVNSRVAWRDASHGPCAGEALPGPSADFSNCDSSLSDQEVRPDGPGPAQKDAVFQKDGGFCQVHEIISRDTPDRNKQKTSVITKIRKTTAKNGQDPDKLLASMGYTLVSVNSVEVYSYHKNGYVIELSRFIKDNCSDMEGREKPPELYEYFLVKVFIEAEAGLAEETILNGAFRDLEDDIQLTKPPLSWF